MENIYPKISRTANAVQFIFLFDKYKKALWDNAQRAFINLNLKKCYAFGAAFKIFSGVPSSNVLKLSINIFANFLAVLS